MMRGCRRGGWWLLVLLALIGCFGASQERTRQPGSALWLAEGVPVPEPSQLARLRDGGVGEVFVEAARVDELGVLIPLALPDLPGATPATLVVSGQWVAGVADESRLDGLVRSLDQLRFDAEAAGLVPVGVHFDLLGSADLEAYATVLGGLRERLEDGLFVSASVERTWLEQPMIGSLADEVDFLVPFLYGQRRSEREVPEAWDFLQLERSLGQIEALDVPYLLGVITLGTATHIDKSDSVRARTYSLKLHDLLWNRRLKLRPGFSLEGVNRQVLTVVAERSLSIGDWSLRRGDRVRVVRSATSHIEELLRLRGAWNLEHLLGQVYFRAPRDDEGLSLTIDNLLNGLDPSPATPDLQLDVRLQRGTGRGWLYRFTLTNTNGEMTGLSVLDGNYLEIATEPGRFGRVQEGDFYRFELYKRQEDGSLRATFRQADVLRLHLPLLDGARELTSGDVEVVLPQRQPRLTLRGSFLLTDGRSLEAGPRVWQGGRFSVDESGDTP